MSLKKFIIVLAALCSGCSTLKTPMASYSSIPPGAETLLSQAYRLVEAYQKDDATTWNSLVCGASSNEEVFGLKAQKFLGRIQAPRLVSVSSVSNAGNRFMNQYRWPEVSIEVEAENYPVGHLLLRFMEDKGQGCVGVSY